MSWIPWFGIFRSMLDSVNLNPYQHVPRASPPSFALVIQRWGQGQGLRKFIV